MKLIEFAHQHFRSLFKLYLFILFLFLLQIILSFAFVYKTSLAQIESNLQSLSHRIENDLKFNGQTWDTSLYNSDPHTPYPNGSSGYTSPLYIITREGFIIERSSPIRGFLDTSDYKHLIQFQKPQTIAAITNEKWRILSRPIEKDGNVLGVVTVSYYSPREEEFTLIDRKMQENIDFIISKIIFSNNKIDATKLDIRNIHYEFSFEVVDIYNNVLMNNGRVPTFIDTSYFAKEVDEEKQRTIIDSKTKEQYLIIAHPIRGKNAEPVGVIVVGQSVQSLYIILQNYVFFALLLSSLCIVPLLVYVIYIFRKEVLGLLKEKLAIGHVKKIGRIFFDKKNSFIQINEEKFEIPFASNQYYVCDAIFSSPLKKWEYDELLEKLGDNNIREENGRKVYDAVLAINKKCGTKIIEYKNKIYIMNSLLLPHLLKK